MLRFSGLGLGNRDPFLDKKEAIFSKAKVEHLRRRPKITLIIWRQRIFDFGKGINSFFCLRVWDHGMRQ
ncbi:MAG: hypothetical protein WBW41_14690 [Verrucomicrobiia bacterium]